jgi:hypothetical protein
MHCKRDNLSGSTLHSADAPVHIRLCTYSLHQCTVNLSERYKNDSFGRSKSPPKAAAPAEAESEFSHMRYTCTLKQTVEKLINDELSIDEHPSVVPLPESATSGSSRRDAASNSTSSSGTKSIRSKGSSTPGRPTSVQVHIQQCYCLQH